jgi:hypothetical protein
MQDDDDNNNNNKTVIHLPISRLEMVIGDA